MKLTTTMTAPIQQIPRAVTPAPAASGLPALPITLETISRVAGLSALVGAVLAGAGMLYTYSYLSAWGIAPPLVKMDPLSAALRAEGIAYQVLLFASGFSAVRAAFRWRPRLRMLRMAAVAGAAVAIAALVIESVAGGFLGGAIALVAGASLAAIHRVRPVRRRTTLSLASFAILLSSYVTGTEIGRATRDDPIWQREVQVVTDMAIGDLARTTIEAGIWQYDDLYLIFRDERQLYVGTPDSTAAWLLDAEHILSLRISPPGMP